MAATSIPPRPARTGPRSGPSWWRRPWIAPLFLLAGVFLAYSVPPYLTLDPSRSNLEVPPGNPVFYPLLVAHVLAGTVAMAAACFQIWPRFRRNHRRGHRLTGRIYVFAGVLPAGITALYVGQLTAFGPSVQVGNTVNAVLWLTVTAIGYRMVRQRRYAEHRMWMIRSFALTMSIIVSRLINVPAIIILAQNTDSAFAGSEDLMLQSATSIGVWCSPLLTLLLAEWAIHRGAANPRQDRPRRANSSDPS